MEKGELSENWRKNYKYIGKHVAVNIHTDEPTSLIADDIAELDIALNALPYNVTKDLAIEYVPHPTELTQI